MERTVYIYALCDPDTDEVYYIGKTVDLEIRYKQHLADTFNTQRTAWIEELQASDKEPSLKVLEETTEEQWGEREQYWIEQMRSQGAPLTNMRPGGGSDTRRKRPSYAQYKTRQISLRLTPAEYDLIAGLAERMHTHMIAAVVTAVHALSQQSTEQLVQAYVQRMLWEQEN